MAESHYCTEHQVAFFKRGKMKGFAHPIEGTDPTEWCNEDKVKQAMNELPPQPHDKVPPKEQEIIDKA